MYISVILCTIRRPDLVAQCVRSLERQTYQDFELLILDDGSKDNTAAIVQSYSDTRINLIQKQNEGVAKTLNKGV